MSIKQLIILNILMAANAAIVWGGLVYIFATK